MDWTLLGNGFKLMLLGMGVVFIFLVIMIIAMNLLKRVLAPFAGMLEAPKAPAKTKNVAGSGDDARLAAVAAAAVEAARAK